MQWTLPFGGFLFVLKPEILYLGWIHRITYSRGGGDTPINYCSCSEFWNFCPEKKQFFKYLTAFLSNFWCCCCCVIWPLLVNDCFSLPLTLPSCSHTKLLLKWENIGSERVVWFHCGKHLDCVNFFPLVFTLLLIFFKTVFFQLFRKV